MSQINFLTLEHNSEAHSCKHCCRGKERSIAYSQSLFVTLVIQHAKHVSRIIMSSVACLTIQYFPRYLTNGTIAGKEVEYNMHILIFSTNFSAIFLILRRIQPDFITNRQEY
jgi:hypothetical protein